MHGKSGAKNRGLVKRGTRCGGAISQGNRERLVPVRGHLTMGQNRSPTPNLTHWMSKTMATMDLRRNRQIRRIGIAVPSHWDRSAIASHRRGEERRGEEE